MHTQWASVSCSCGLRGTSERGGSFSAPDTVSPVSHQLPVKTSDGIRYFFPTTGTKEEKKIRQSGRRKSPIEKREGFTFSEIVFSSARGPCCGSGWWEGSVEWEGICQRGTARISRS